jgi:hypothetical protein
MKYARKQLYEVIARLQKARATKQSLKDLGRAIRRGEPVELTLQTAGIPPLVVNSAEIGRDMSLHLVRMLLSNTQADINHLKQHELHCCEVLVLLARQKQQQAVTVTEAAETKVITMEQPLAAGEVG